MVDPKKLTSRLPVIDEQQHWADPLDFIADGFA
jgi:hypothetical protein